MHRSHMLMAVLQIAETGQQPGAVASLQQDFFAAGRFEDEPAATIWIAVFLDIMVPYVQEWTNGRGSSKRLNQVRLSLFREIPLESGQLFAPYKHASKSFHDSALELKMRKVLIRSAGGQTSDRKIRFLGH